MSIDMTLNPISIASPYTGGLSEFFSAASVSASFGTDNSRHSVPSLSI
jgi:hypothetical protein